MNIVVDKHIPYIEGLLETFATVEYLSGREFTPDKVKNADVLVVRTVTQVNKELLQGSKIKLVCSATIGFDHIDTAYCQSQGIRWCNAPGCNAGSVKQYVTAALLEYAISKKVPLKGKTIGIVGVGNVGKQIVAAALQLGLVVLQCDPYRARIEGQEQFCSLETIARRADIITFHTPLTFQGEFATFHLADASFFRSLRRIPLIINTARGGVIDTYALKEAMEKGEVADCVIDCWENEPNIDRALLQRAFIATPHIAGYSADGKAQASQVVLEQIASFCGVDAKLLPAIVVPSPRCPEIDLDKFVSNRAEQALLATYSIKEDSAKLKRAPASFTLLREQYPLRRELKAYRTLNASAKEESFLDGWR